MELGGFIAVCLLFAIVIAWQEKRIKDLDKENDALSNKASFDDILLQEIYSLREKLKIAVYHLHNFDPTFDINDYIHRLNSVDFDQWIEEICLHEQKRKVNHGANLRKKKKKNKVIN